MEKVDSGYEFYVIMVKRSDGMVYSDLAKTNHRIYFSYDEAEEDLKNYPNHIIVPMIAYLK